MATIYDKGPSVRLPWRRRRREEDLNDILAWLFEAEPQCAIALAERLGISMWITRDIRCDTRRGNKSGGRPDLVVTSLDEDGNEVARIILELKTKLTTGLTDREAAGYPGSHLDGSEAGSKFGLVAPHGYDRKHSIPKSATFLTTNEVRAIIEGQLRTDLARWLLADAWSHFFGTQVSSNAIGRLLAEQDSALKSFLSEIREHARDQAGLVPGNLAPAKDRSDYGFSIFDEANAHLAWVGFYREGKKGRGRLGVNVRSKKVIKGCKGLGGAIHPDDTGLGYAGHWVPEVDTDFTPDDIVHAGMARLFALLAKEVS
ncbi:MAG: hypothetical protein RIT81_34625 [Deltaproteobacteria bacterium]